MSEVAMLDSAETEQVSIEGRYELIYRGPSIKIGKMTVGVARVTRITLLIDGVEYQSNGNVLCHAGKMWTLELIGASKVIIVIGPAKGMPATKPEPGIPITPPKTWRRRGERKRYV